MYTKPNNLSQSVRHLLATHQLPIPKGIQHLSPHQMNAVLEGALNQWKGEFAMQLERKERHV